MNFWGASRDDRGRGVDTVDELPRFQCCFCGAAIVDDDIEPLQLLIVESAQWKNGRDSSPQHPTQSMFAHVDCLGFRLHAGVPFLDHRQCRSGESNL